MKRLFANTNQKEIIIKAFKALIIRAFGYGFGFIFIWLIARNLGANVQGVFTIAFLFLSVGSMVAKMGFSTAIIKWIANETTLETRRVIIKKSFLTVLGGSILVTAVIFLFAPLIAEAYQKPDVVKSIQLAALTIPVFSLIEVGSAVFKGIKETSTFSMYFDLLKFVFPVLVFVLLYFGWNSNDIELPILAYLIGHSILLCVLLLHLQLRFSLFSQGSISASRYSIKEMLGESYPMVVASSIVMIMGWSDVFILGFFVEEDDIGVYGTAVRIATLVSFTYTAIAAITTPKIAEFFFQNNTEELKKTVAFSANLMFLCALPVFVVLFCLAGFFLSLFGQEYIAGSTVLRILLIAQFTNVITGPVGPIFQMTGGQKKLQNFMVLALLINIVISLVLVLFYSMEGVAIGSAIGMAAWNILGAVYLKKRQNLRTWVKF